MSWMQDVRDGTVIRRPLFGCLFRHDWRAHQHCVEASDNARVTMVIAWRQCPRCGKSQLIHILK